MDETLLVFWAHFLLIVLRCSGLFILSPYWGRANIPTVARALLPVLMAGVLVGLYPPSGAGYATVIGYAGACIAELAAGLVIGFFTTLFFSAVYVAGQMIDMQIGFGMVNVLDPSVNAQVPLTGSLLNIMMIECFLVTDGPLWLITLLGRTFSVMPPGQISLSPELALLAVEAFSRSFLYGLRVAIPMIAAGLLGEIALGLLVRTAPQMNMFVVGMSMKVVLGLVIMITLVPVFSVFTGPIFDDLYEYVGRVFS